MRADSRLRVIHVVNSLAAGGMENGVVNICSQLPERDFLSEVYCLAERGEFAERLPAAVAVWSGGKAGGFSFRSVIALSKYLAERSPDVVHTHNLGPLIYSGPATRFGSKFPILHGEHSELTREDLSGKRRLQRALLYRACRCVHTVSRMQAKSLAASGLPFRRLESIVNGVDTARFRLASKGGARSALGIPESAKVLGVVGRFGPFKRHLELLDCFADLAANDPDARLLVVGEGGPNRAAVLERMRRPDVEGRVHWLGLRGDLERIYPAMDLLVVPSTNEGLSNVVLEAMACGVPVLTNDCCGSSEAIRDGTDGFVRPLGPVDALRGEMERALASVRGDSRFGESARRRVEENFSLGAMVRGYARLYREVATAGRVAIVSARSEGE